MMITDGWTPAHFDRGAVGAEKRGEAYQATIYPQHGFWHWRLYRYDLPADPTGDALTLEDAKAAADAAIAAFLNEGQPVHCGTCSDPITSGHCTSCVTLIREGNASLIEQRTTLLARVAELETENAALRVQMKQAALLLLKSGLDDEAYKGAVR